MSTPTLPRPAEATAEPLTVTDQPQMSGRTDCYACPHPRTRHGRNGCTSTETNNEQCPCSVTYMDL